MATTRLTTYLCKACVVVLSLGLWIGPVLAQGVSGTIHGKITDPTKALIPGVSVTATNVETGLKREAVSDDTGFYTLEALPPGIYTISAEIVGFKKYERTGVQLTVGQKVRADIELVIGEVSESITVHANAVMVDTKTPELSGLVDDKRITDLPLNGRNVISLASLIPGVSTVNAPQVQTGSRSGPRLTVHGSRANQNYFTLNGAYFNHASRNTGMNPPPPDAVREFRIKTNNFSAAEGRNAGSIVSVATRSGTNEIHGAVWEFHRNDNLNARSFFQTRKPQRIQNQYGAAAGGPIIKNKLFVFATYEGFRDRPQPSSTNAFPPTEAERAGDFSNRSRQLVNPYTRERFSGNKVPTALFDAVSVKLLQLIPLPNASGGRLVTNNPAPNNNDLFMVRNDFQISDKQTFFWHYYYNRNDLPPRIQGNIPGWMEQSTESNFHNLGINHTYILSPNLLNSVTFAMNPADQEFQNSRHRTTESLGMNYPNYTSYGAPRFSVSGRFSLSAGSNTLFNQDAYALHEGMSWTRGKHTLKYGVEYFRLEFLQSWLDPPSFSFNGTRSGDAMLDFLMGAWRTNRVPYGRRMNDTIQPWYWSFYFQDEVRISPRLSLTLGLRYELPSPWNDKREIGLSSIVLPIEAHQSKAPLPNVPPGYLFANFDLPAGLVRADKNNFAPRIGFAFDPNGDGLTSIRGGFGVFYDTSNADTLAQVNPPFASTRAFSNGRLGAPNAGVTQPLPPTNPQPQEGGFDLPMSPFSTDQTLRNTYMFHWNLGLQRQVSRDIMISADYVGKIGRKLLSFWPFNPAVFIPGVDAAGNPRSTLENVNDRVLYGKGIYGAYYNLMLSGMFDSWYNGLDLEVNKRLSDGFSLLTAYTFSRAIDENSTDNLGGDTPNPFDPKDSERGLADFHRKHVLAISTLWSPFAAQAPSEGLLKQIVTGWTFSPIIRYASGRPLEFWNGEDRALNGTADGSEQHPNALRNPKKSHDSNHSKRIGWFDTAAFELPAIGTYGNAAKGLITGPSSFTWDLAILRDFHLGVLSEESRVQFRAEFFNLLNNVNFSNPDTTILSDQFGQITGTFAAREIQFGLKVLW